MNRRYLLAAALICLSFSVLLAKPGTVKTRDGHVYQGDVREKPEGVDVVSSGITLTVGRDNVASIDYATNSIEQEYRQRLARLPKDATAKDHMTLARWLMDSAAYTLARDEVDAAVKLEPDNAEAIAMGRTIDAQIRMGGGGPKPEVPPKPVAGNTSGPVTPPPAKTVLSADQINVIRQHEVRESDTNIRARFENDVQRRFTDYAHVDTRAFNGYSHLQKVLAIRKDGTAEMMKDVKILNDPASLAEFRGAVQRTVISGCATANCHGGTAAGDFVLIVPTDSDAATYTNFYILSRYSHAIGDKTYKMIDRTQPEKSLLLQYGLARNKAEAPHPELPAPLIPAFRAVEDPRYGVVIKWIKALDILEPDYGIDYTPPKGTSTSRPASQPK